MDKYKQRFQRHCDGENLEHFDQVYNDLISKYNNTHRFYHNFDHIKYCLNLLDKVRDEIDDPLAVEMAIWFHDTIYDTGSRHNEEQSADLAVRELEKLKFSQSMLSKIHGLILITKHSYKPSTKDENYLLDIDLGILGAEETVFQEYEKNIRKEYSWVEDVIYRKKRTEVLTNFFVKKYLYRTSYFISHFEEKAKRNLEKTINEMVKQ